MILNKNYKGLQFILLGTVALSIAGLFAIFLVAARSPGVTDLLPHKNFFKTALTIHVNLSVLVWLLCGCMMVFTNPINFTPSFKRFFIAMFLGFLVMSLSVFDVGAEAISSNYVPYISSFIFTYGLAIFLGAVFATCLYGLYKRIFRYKNFKIDSSSAIAITIIIAGFAWLNSYLELNSVYFDGKYYDADYYEILFWPAGHILQFAYIQLVIFCWLKLEERISGRYGYKIDFYCSLINIVAVLATIPAIFYYEIDSFEYVNFYTQHMRGAGGLATILALFFIFKSIKKNFSNFKNLGIYRSVITWSFILFLSGGFIAMLIEGSNTKIPAHYHGSIIGISLGLMGYAYMLIEKCGHQLKIGKILKCQPFLYGFGQLIHIFGLAASGGYGALRKTPGVDLSAEAKFYMGIMGGGGLLSIIGGLFFVIIVFNSVRAKQV